MELLLASNNRHKLAEFTRLFPGHAVRMPGEAGIDFEFPENGKDFLENALGKARALFSLARSPVIADDSGLCVHALGGGPGIYSSRYGAVGGSNLEAAQRNAYLLSRMGGAKDRRAYFVCCLVLIMEEARFFIAQETVHGLITEAPRGTNGFGYDPLFFVPGTRKTIAELPDTDKDRLSHRGKAARRIASMLEGDA
jgi:XTP/dITP diphosphohydrolase